MERVSINAIRYIMSVEDTTAELTETKYLVGSVISEGKTPNAVREWQPEQRRRRGKLRKKWIDCLQEDSNKYDVRLDHTAGDESGDTRPKEIEWVIWGITCVYCKHIL